MTDAARALMPAAAERRLAPREPAAVAIGLNLLRFAGAVAGVAVAVAAESLRSGDPIALEPRVLGHRPAEELRLVDVRS